MVCSSILRHGQSFLLTSARAIFKKRKEKTKFYYFPGNVLR
jgi:hypothetical protein